MEVTVLIFVTIEKQEDMEYINDNLENASGFRAKLLKFNLR